jgi:hypothetical protein
MDLKQKFDSLRPREKRLLGILGVVAALLVGLLLPIAVSARLVEKRTLHDDLSLLATRLYSEREQILALQNKNKLVLSRYKTPAPPLAGFLDNSARSLEIEIPEFKDRSPVPIGKAYEERATDITLKKIGMRKLVLFLEKIGQASFPVSVSKFSLRKRATEEDSWDASLTVSAYHRIAVSKDKGSETPKEETR